MVVPIERDSAGDLGRLWLEIDRARHAIVRGKPPAIIDAAQRLIGALGSVRVRVELAHAAAAFAEGLDERPDAEEWVYFAVAARATLDHAEKCGARPIAAALAELDESFEDAREAVLLLEPEDYKEALAATPPKMHAWWGERARIDNGLREIDLERALGALVAD
jgi:hypothetical protein